MKMAHRKAHSHPESELSVPFSWEEKPGIPKLIPNQQSFYENKAELSTANSIHHLPLRKSASSHFHSATNMMTSLAYADTKISPPPLGAQRSPILTPSRKGLWKLHQDDPFAAAVKKCTKSIPSHGMPPSGSKNYTGSSKEKFSKNIFSCKKSCDVKEDNLVRLVDIPPLPRVRKFKVQNRESHQYPMMRIKETILTHEPAL